MESSAGVVLAAAGSGRRMNDPVPKQWRLLGGVPLLVHALRFFDSLDSVGQINVALDAETLGLDERTGFLRSSRGKTVRLVAGGAHRQDSVWRALGAFEPAPEVVLIHDAARPFPPPEAVAQSIVEARRHGGAILARPVHETVKRVDADLNVVETIDRSRLWSAQTPQTFLYAALCDAYRAAGERLESFTDDASVFEAAGGTVRIVESSERNFKVTWPEDFRRAERLLAQEAKK